ncbi:LytR/AlgR family response regulator transcription factor [Longitalea luteola]|uniref:LytR/AlgR family response regulator transcription factor n=1 Tax=Longitalea luteola TaxID=2812563 RepID=UPI001A97C9D2|nr:LytTR family DNA-binding domain-containing protein [Longitalea luteola]
MIKCLAVDDEALSLDLLEDNIKRIPFLHLVQRCKNAYEAMDVLRREQIDLIFLDIQMPGVTGTQFLQSLTYKPVVIFITAFKKYALEGFELDVLDYLVKPVTFERFLRAVNKAADFCTLKKQGVQSPVTQAANDYFFVNVEYSLVKIAVGEITHIESLRDYIKIYLLQHDKPVLTKLPLKSLADKLPATGFVRVHKSFMVAIDKISSIRKNRVYINDHIIPVSDFYKEELVKAISHKL